MFQETSCVLVIVFNSLPPGQPHSDLGLTYFMHPNKSMAANARDF